MCSDATRTQYEIMIMKTVLHICGSFLILQFRVNLGFADFNHGFPHVPLGAHRNIGLQCAVSQVRDNQISSHLGNCAELACCKLQYGGEHNKGVTPTRRKLQRFRIHTHLYCSILPPF